MSGPPVSTPPSPSHIRRPHRGARMPRGESLPLARYVPRDNRLLKFEYRRARCPRRRLEEDRGVQDPQRHAHRGDARRPVRPARREDPQPQGHRARGARPPEARRPVGLRVRHGRGCRQGQARLCAVRVPGRLQEQGRPPDVLPHPRDPARAQHQVARGRPRRAQGRRPARPPAGRPSHPGSRTRRRKTSCSSSPTPSRPTSSWRRSTASGPTPSTIPPGPTSSRVSPVSCRRV